MDPNAVCYRHPDRRAGVVCQRCDRPICPSCMHTASVGFHCPECSRGNSQRVIPMRTIRRGAALGTPVVTIGLIVVNVLVELLSLGNGSNASEAGGRFLTRWALYGPNIGERHEWYRLVTGGFLHSGLLHLGFNMFALWVMGSQLEPALGRARFGLIYAAGLLGGAAGVMVLSPNDVTVGASGAIFGMFAAAFVLQRAMGIDPWRSGIGGIILINLLITIAIPGISLGGHLGGLGGGALVGWTLVEGPRRFRSQTTAYLVAVGLLVLYALIAIGAASSATGRVV